MVTLFLISVCREYVHTAIIYANGSYRYFSHRLFVIVLVGLSILWVPLLRGSHGSSIFTYTVKVGTFFQPPIIGAFTLALFTSRVNEKVSRLVCQ